MRTMIFQLAAGYCTNFSPWPPARVYNLLQRETEALEYDYYTLCARHRCLSPAPRSSRLTRAWMSHYQAENYFAIDPVYGRRILCVAICHGTTACS